MVSLSTIVAVEDFTADNGATEIIPGSQDWGDEQVAGYYHSGDTEADAQFARRVAELATPVLMPAGACLVFAGTLLHRGGANHSGGTRRAFSRPRTT